MAKKVTAVIRLQIPAGAANPAPPVGPALGQAGVNIMGFCKEFNAATQSQAGMAYLPLVSALMSISWGNRDERPRFCPPSSGGGRQEN